MACNASIWFSITLLFFSFSMHNIVESCKSPSRFVFPISKHDTTHKHTITIHQGTPLTSIDLAVDLCGPYLWKICSSANLSTTYESIPCHSPQCSLAQHPTNFRPKCERNTTCCVHSKNIFNRNVTRMKLSQDVFSLQSVDGSKPTSVASIPKFIFLCSPPFHPKGKPWRAQGVAGLGHGPLGLPSQIFATFNISRKFAICLSLKHPGVLIFGDGPYVFDTGIDLSEGLTRTPLYLKTQNHGHHEHFNSNDYFIKVSSLRVNEIKIPLNSSLLAKISINNPYTYLKTSIYNSVATLFIINAYAYFPMVDPIAPFKICFFRRNRKGDVVEADMPYINFGLQKESVFWRIFGDHSLVQMGNDTVCLGIFDGGVAPKHPIRIGTNVLENYLLQFDLKSSTLGFTSLDLAGTDCASFNFTSAI